MLIIKITDFADGRQFLSGLAGRRIYPRLIASIDKQAKPTPVFLDFAGLSASGSFFSQAVLPLRIYARRMDGYIVVCNLDEESRDELAWLLDVTPDAIFICNLDEDGTISEPRWIGNLEEKQLFTLRAVEEETQTDATHLSEKYKDVQATGWNNRLATLSQKGLLMEFRSGRSKTYRPVLETQREGV